MRIVGGQWRSRRLQTPAGRELRPSSDRLRETLFDILGPAVAGRGFVDAYAGTGAIGIEAFSRGARPVIWIESSAAAARLLRANLASLGVADDARAVVLERRLPQAVAQLAASRVLQAAGGAAFLFLDPPYDDLGAPERLLHALERHGGILAPGGQVIAESRRDAPLPERVGGWGRVRLHTRGRSQLVFFARVITNS